MTEQPPNELNREAEQPGNAQDSIPVKAQITITEPVQVKVEIIEPAKTPDAAAEPGNKETVLELYKLEYTTSVKRHDDIFKSLWTNFSYMAILAGGILTFGKEALSIEFLIIIACLPLVFWFWGSYLPLDKYGRLASNRASKIEDLINEIYLEDFKAHRSEADKAKSDIGLYLYRDFEGRNNKSQNIVQAKYKNSIEHLINWLEHKSSVRGSVGIAFIGLHLVIIIAIICWAAGGFNAYKPAKTGTTETKLESINNTLGNMSNSINGLKDSYENNSPKGEAANKNLNTEMPPKTAETNKAGANK